MAAAGEEQVKLGRTGLGGNSPEAGWCAVQTLMCLMGFRKTK